MPLTITLHDGSEHAAQFATLTAMMPLLKPMMGDDEDFTTITQESASKMLPRLMQSLGDADSIKDLASGLLTLFPSLPKDKVWFNDFSRSIPYGVAGLEVTEIFMIVAKCLESANKAIDTGKLAELTQSLTPQSEPVKPIEASKAFNPRKKSKKR